MPLTLADAKASQTTDAPKYDQQGMLVPSGGPATPAPTAPPTAGPTAAAPLANGQQTGSAQPPAPGAPPQAPTTTPPLNAPPTTPPPTGLQVPANAANLVYDPISNSQVSPAEKALNEMNASKTPPPQSSGDVGDTVQKAIYQNTPATPEDTTTPNVDAFYNNNESIQQNAQDLMDFFSPASTTQLLTDQLSKITSDQGVLSGLNTQLMNINTVMAGTPDDLRKEIQAAGGMATESQVQALAVSRNKTLLQQATSIQNSISNAQNAVANDTTLFQNEKDMANTQFTQRTQVYQMAVTNHQNMVNAAKDAANTVISAIGYKGYLDSLSAQGPSAVAAGEQALGLQPGQLQSLVTTQQQQQNAAAIANSGATTPFVNKGGEIQSQTGYAYTSEQDFFNKTGMTLQQAQAKGMVSDMKPSLDIQAKQADVALKNAQVSEVPLDIAAKKANITQSNASAAASYASAANSSASAAKTKLETQQLADGSSNDATQQKLEQEYRTVLSKEVNSRSGTVGTEDAKVVQANHLAALLNQYYDSKTGQYNVPKAQYGELVLGLAGMLSKTGTPTDSQVDNINQRTAKGDINGAISYITGTPINGNTQAVIKNLADSISRQAKTAESNREAGLNVLRGLAPTDLDPNRAKALEQNTLAPYTGINGIDNKQSPTAPLDVGATGTFSSGVTWKIIK